MCFSPKPKSRNLGIDSWLLKASQWVPGLLLTPGDFVCFQKATNGRKLFFPNHLGPLLGSKCTLPETNSQRFGKGGLLRKMFIFQASIFEGLYTPWNYQFAPENGPYQKESSLATINLYIFTRGVEGHGALKETPENSWDKKGIKKGSFGYWTNIKVDTPSKTNMEPKNTLMAKNIYKPLSVFGVLTMDSSMFISWLVETQQSPRLGGE